MRNVIREAIEWDGFSFVDITSQCIENNGRRIGFASANDMLTFYRKTYKRAGKDAIQLNPFEIGIVSPASNRRRDQRERPAPTSAAPGALPDSAVRTDDLGDRLTGADGAPARSRTATDDEKARRSAESNERAAVMAQLSAEVKLSVAKRELTLAEALAQAGLPIPNGRGPGRARHRDPVAAGDVESRRAAGPDSPDQPAELDAQKGEAAGRGTEPHRRRARHRYAAGRAADGGGRGRHRRSRWTRRRPSVPRRCGGPALMASCRPT